MNILLIFFALPIAVIIISIALQKILKNPLLVAAIIFAIFLIVTFVVNNLEFLIAAIVYAMISFLTALITCIVGRLLNRWERENLCCRRRREEKCSCDDDNRNRANVLTIRSVEDDASNCGCNRDNDIRSYQITSSNGSTTRVNVISNNNNNASNTASECCRRR